MCSSDRDEVHDLVTVTDFILIQIRDGEKSKKKKRISRSPHPFIVFLPPRAMPSRHENVVAEPPSSINPYQILGIEEQATADEIKSAYRKKALQHHPGPSFCRLFPSPDKRRRTDSSGARQGPDGGARGGQTDLPGDCVCVCHPVGRASPPSLRPDGEFVGIARPVGR